MGVLVEEKVRKDKEQELGRHLEFVSLVPSFDGEETLNQN